MDVVTPDVDTVPSDQHSISIGILLHRLLKILSQVLLMGSVLDDRNPESVVVSQVTLLSHTAAEALDLLDIVDLEDLVFARALGLKEESDEDGPLGVSVDAAAGVAAGECGEEERCALGGLVAGW